MPYATNPLNNNEIGSTDVSVTLTAENIERAMETIEQIPSLSWNEISATERHEKIQTILRKLNFIANPASRDQILKISCAINMSMSDIENMTLPEFVNILSKKLDVVKSELSYFIEDLKRQIRET